MAQHGIRKLVVGHRQVPRWRRKHSWFMPEGYEIPGQGVDDNFLASQ